MTLDGSGGIQDLSGWGADLPKNNENSNPKSYEFKQIKPKELPSFKETKRKIVDDTKKKINSDPKLSTVGENIRARDALVASKRYVGENEIKNFFDIFGLTTEESFLEKVKEIQKEAGFSGRDLDGVIGTKTLEYIYKNHYLKMNINSLPFEVKTRIELFKNLEGYKLDSKNPRNLPIVGVGNPFSSRYFKGLGNSENIPGTSINRELGSQLSGKLDANYNGGNSIQIDKLPNGKYYLAMFVKGKLSVLTYVSPGDPGHRTPDYSGEKAKNIGGLSRHYISGSYPKRENGVNGGAVMPLAYAIDASKGIWGHVGDVTGVGASKGCVRAPGFYQQAIFNLLQKNGPKNFKAKTGNLY